MLDINYASAGEWVEKQDVCNHAEYVALSYAIYYMMFRYHYRSKKIRPEALRFHFIDFKLISVIVYEHCSYFLNKMDRL
jgi:hypothetical protein